MGVQAAYLEDPDRDEPEYYHRYNPREEYDHYPRRGYGSPERDAPNSGEQCLIQGCCLGNPRHSRPAPQMDPTATAGYHWCAAVAVGNDTGIHS